MDIDAEFLRLRRRIERLETQQSVLDELKTLLDTIDASHTVADDQVATLALRLDAVERENGKTLAGK